VIRNSAFDQFCETGSGVAMGGKGRREFAFIFLKLVTGEKKREGCFF